ncbi:TIGR04282 family arsenosugar biosynthesis glycosyltransferase [Aureisphaera galaxeae]|uniref:TIGR04282 family arsenosugar biosynthesis glycosyltransferase n=1 Tax=Aureisphaera galaxeae TaxID=1538023 RepID=UPI0023510127|nr:TIGR04282 family arsenosugar biosynthesis glycosyltransferase [Aureisphaera galaxeae]MDC8002984.1 TIGR04282 family arsenosugar biosynthesis glycosyltransferase [Aureisphaera galaxeae]
MTKDLLLIFTRNPELGKCKTRLAATIGDEAALDIYKFLLHHTVSITQHLKVEKQVHYSVKIRENDLWDEAVYNKKQQYGDDLGLRMMHAFEQGFAEGFERIIIIGSDLYDLSQSDLEKAFSALNDHDYVVGPAEDGGYYLLGMKRLKPELFLDKKWGTSAVLKDTLANLDHENVYLLPERNDVDYYEDIKDIEAFQPFLTHLKTE